MSVDNIPVWTVADRMRKAREYRGLSQSEFADETGLSRRTISAIETGGKSPKTLDYNVWQFATGVPREWLEFGVHPLGLEPRTHWLIDQDGVRIAVTLPPMPLAPVTPIRRRIVSPEPAVAELRAA